MTLNIQCPDITLKQEVIDFLNQKLNVLARRYNEIISVNAPFGREKYSTNANKLCETRLIIPGYGLIASFPCRTFEAAK
jgi:hypothetical protein